MGNLLVPAGTGWQLLCRRLFEDGAAMSDSGAGSSPRLWAGASEGVGACAGSPAVAKVQRVAHAWADVSSWMLGPSKGKCEFSAWGGFLLL